nr:nucleic acid-binding protein [Garlic virus C]
MHPYNLNFLCCLHFTKPSLPCEIRMYIYNLAAQNLKLGRVHLGNKPFQGTSKCAARRRAKRYNRCFDCGAYLNNDHTCKALPNRASIDCLSVIHEGPAKLYAEGAFRRQSFAEQLILNDLELMKLYDR